MNYKSYSKLCLIVRGKFLGIWYEHVRSHGWTVVIKTTKVNIQHGPFLHKNIFDFDL